MKRLFMLVILLSILSCRTDSKSEDTTIELKEDLVSEEANYNNSNEVSAPIVKLSAASLSATINIDNINYGLIESRLLEKINEERRQLDLTLFTVRETLKQAAQLHNNYMVNNNILDHNQRNTSTPTMSDRVAKAGGGFRTMGENIQYEGFVIRTTNGVESIIAPTYEGLAEKLWMNWKTSPGHYRNLINPKFQYLGTALKWSSRKNAIFATQVYGG